MAYWIPEIQKLIIDQITKTPQLRTILQTRVYSKELAVVKSPKFPCLSFEIDPVTLLTNICDARLKLWIWNNSSNSRDLIYDAYIEFVKKFDNQRFTVDKKHFIFQRRMEPVELYDQVLDADYISAIWSIRGVINE